MKQSAVTAFFVVGFVCIIAKLIVASGYFIQHVQDSSSRPTALFGLGFEQLLGITGIVFLLVGAWLAMRNDAAKNKIE